MGKKHETEAISDLKVTSSTGNVWIDLPISYTRENLPVGDEDIETPNIRPKTGNIWRELLIKPFREKTSVLVFLLLAFVPKHWNHWKSYPAKMVVPVHSELYWDGS